MPPDPDRIEAWLSERDETLAGCWTKAHQEMAAKAGHAGAISLAHVARQIPTYLFEAIGGQGGLHVDHSGKVKELDRLLNNRNSTLFTMVEGAGVTPAFQLEGEEVQIVKDMIRQQKDADERNYINVAKALFSHVLEEDKDGEHVERVATEWKKMQRFFNNVAHLKLDQAMPGWEDFETNLGILDSLLDLLAKSWFEREQKLKELLENANQS
jgi:hypothetical protein